MTWFKVLTGFEETSPSQVRENLSIEGNTLMSRINGKTYQYGSLEIPSLAELRERVRACTHLPGRIIVKEIVADIQDLHAKKANAGALFQVASQLNLLEMVSPEVTPERGVGRYEHDRTQGPACAIACGAGTIHRNYFSPVNGQTGQSAENQIDCLKDMGIMLDNSGERLWKMQNGYALASEKGLTEISKRIQSSSEEELDKLRMLLRIGLQWDTRVTIRDAKHIVSQAYCSALPVAYSDLSAGLWENFARLVLEAAYEATLCAAILNSINTGNNQVFLTLLGGGAFGNETGWIMAAIRRAVNLYRDWDLEISIVSYGSSKSLVREFAAEFSA